MNENMDKDMNFETKEIFEIKEIKDKKIWEDFLSNFKEKTFLQSWNWGEFNKVMENKILRMGIYQKQELIATALIIKIKARRGTFLFLPHGPNLKSTIGNSKFEILKFFLKGLKKIAEKENAAFIRIAPIWKRNEENIKIFKKLSFREAPIHMHPELTWELDIKPPEKELLMQMRKTTRYLIRRAQKNEDIKIIKSQDIEDVKKFNELYRTTKARHHFIPFSLEYLKNEFLSFSSNHQSIPQAQSCSKSIKGQISLFLGSYKNEIVSSGIFVFWQNIAFYHHGASSLKYPKIPVSYLLLWEAIKLAQEKGCEKFNFWGIAPMSALSPRSPIFRKHPWAGLSLFKMGFGGESKEYMKTQDFILSPKYWLSFFIEKLRKAKRGL